ASGGSMLTIRPSYMTAIRSERERTSSSSAETSRTAVPSSRSWTIRRWMNSMAPMSTPRVGWAASRTFGLLPISRATITFCWLPPDRFLAATSIVGVRTSNSLTRRLAHSRIATSFKTNSFHENLGLRSRPRLEFWAIEKLSTYPEHHCARLRGLLVHPEQDLAADHHGRDLFFVGLLRRQVADHLAPAHDRDPIRDVEDLFEFVADEDDGLAGLDQVAQDDEKLLGLLWREHAGRLVEDQDAGAAVEDLDDLGALLQPDRKVAHLGVGVERQAVALGQVVDRLPRAPAVVEVRPGDE